jgi:hypothetical protein
MFFTGEEIRMKAVRISCFIVIAALASVGCHGASGAPVLTPVGPSRIEMTYMASSKPPTVTSTPASTAVQTLPPTPAQFNPPTSVAAAQASQLAKPLTLPASPIPTAADIECSQPWFTDKALDRSCPVEPPVRLEAAYQTFERGAMLWRKTRGFIILPFSPTTGTQAGIVSFYPDEVTVYRDTSADAEWSPPAGLQAPASGFGLLWRGDLFQEPGGGFKAALGWATGSETGYTIMEQSGTREENFGSTKATSLLTYLMLPDGRILQMSRLAAPNAMTSLTLITP